MAFEMGEFLGDPWEIRRSDLWSLDVFGHFPSFSNDFSCQLPTLVIQLPTKPNCFVFLASLPASPKLYKICSWMASSCLIPPSRSWSNGSCNLAANSAVKWWMDVGPLDHPSKSKWHLLSHEKHGKTQLISQYHWPSCFIWQLLGHYHCGPQKIFLVDLAPN